MDTSTPQNDTKPIFSFYEGFDGKYQRVGELRELLPSFRAFYLAERRKEPDRSAIRIINDFNKSIAPFTFFPWEKQYRLWRKKWDAELLAEQGYKQEQRELRQIIKVRDEQNAAIVPDAQTLEMGASTLAGELLNDAMDILKRDQDDESSYDDDIIVKRRNYVLNVFNYVMRAAHSKESLNIKSNADKRETATFMMNILNRAMAGKMSEKDMTMLRASVSTSTPAQTHQSVE
ncbi:MAG: hypothetical protein WDN10_00305 [bacterium]